MGRNLTNLYISQSFEYLVQISGSELQNGLGSTLTGSLLITSSKADTATSASYAISASTVYATQTNANQNHYVTFVATTNAYENIETDNQLVYNPNTNLLTATSSYANSALSSSYALTASYALNGGGTTVSTGSLLTTASAVANVITFTKGDGSTFNVTVSQSGSVSSASYADFAATAGTANTASYVANAVYTASVVDATTTYTKGNGTTFSTTINNVTSSISSSYAATANTANSATTATSASYATNAGTANTAISASFATTASYYGGTVVSASYAVSSSFASTANTANSATTAATASYVVNAISSSYSTTALSSSYAATATSSSYAINASNANNATTATSASYATNANTANSATSASFATTASYALNASINTGSLLLTASAVNNTITFTKGDGSTFPITVATGSAASAFPYTGSAQISGSLIVTGSFSVSGSITGNVVGNNTDTYTTSAAVQQIVTLTQAEYNAIVTPDPNTLYVISGSVPVNTATFATTGSNTFVGNQIISGSLTVTGSQDLKGSLKVTGSVEITDLTALNTQNVIVGYNTSSAQLGYVNIGAGLSLGDTFSDFVTLSQTSRVWRHMATAPNGNVYACVNGGDIYMQTNGTGNFNALSQTSRQWWGMCAAPNGNVYACVEGGDIYMQTNGTGNFVALSQTNRSWVGMAAAPNGDVYACVFGGDIYKQTGGTGNFVALSQTNRNYIDMAAAPNGDVYAAVRGGDIYMQTGGTGNFNSLSQTSRNWEAMAAAANGNVYAAVKAGDIYMQTDGTGNFVGQNQASRDWTGMTSTPSGYTYAAVENSSIYEQDPEIFELKSTAGVAGSTGEIQFNDSGVSGASVDLYWDNTNKRLGVKTTTPSVPLDINGQAKVSGLVYTKAIAVDGSDLNSLTNAGFYDGGSLTNAPTSGYYYITVERYDSDANYVHQTATSFGSGNTGNRVYTRVYIAGSWTVWKEMITAGPSGYITGSIGISGSLTLTGSVRGEVINETYTSNTASIDLSTGNFFTTTLNDGVANYIDFTNINPGQTVNIRVTNGSAGTGTVSFPSSVKQVSGSAYVPTQTANAVDIVTLISFDTTSLYLSNIKKFI
jgi:cytoskeletal protein CcmA (bactofilin family)